MSTLSKKCVNCGSPLRTGKMYCSFSCKNKGNRYRYNPEFHTGEKIKCACGCGELIPKYDNHSRPRKYVIGHTTRGTKRPEMAAILAKNRKNHKREKHWNWKGGKTGENQLIRHSEEYNKWRKAVYARDCFTCQDCKKKIKQLVAHHIKNFNDYPELRFEVNNGITLCRACHKKRHKEIGAKTRF